MMTINIRRLRAWSPAFLGNQEPTAPSVDFSIQSEAKYSPSMITPAQGRRLSDLTKTCVDLGLRVTDNLAADHIVFSSRYGELLNATQLLEMIGQSEVLSPMLFSQSVHNAAIGTYTLIKKTHAATTSLGGGKNGFMMGLVSCAAYLNENPQAQVLYITADETVPEVFEKSLVESNVPYSAALLLSASGPGRKLTFEMNASSNLGTAPLEKNQTPQPVEFIKWFFSESPSLELSGESMSWSLNKC
jgi:hypothetical protein